MRRTFQRVQTFGWLSVEDNVLSALEWRGGGGGILADLVASPTRRSREKQRRARADEVIEQCGLTAVRKEPAGSLPIGLARMVELARAIVDPPQVLLLDEPTSGLDETEAARLGERIQAITGRRRRAQSCSSSTTSASSWSSATASWSSTSVGCSRSGCRRRSRRTPRCAPRTWVRGDSSGEQVQSSHVFEHDKGEPVKRKRLVAVVAVAALVGTVRAGVGRRRRREGGRPGRRTRRDQHLDQGGGYLRPELRHLGGGRQARFDAENAKGGTIGRKYDFIGCNNDGDDPNHDLTIGKRLVQQDGVFAVVPTMTPTLASAPFFAQQKVPFIGWGISTGFCQNPYALRVHGLHRAAAEHQDDGHHLGRS